MTVVNETFVTGFTAAMGRERFSLTATQLNSGLISSVTNWVTIEHIVGFSLDSVSPSSVYTDLPKTPLANCPFHSSSLFCILYSNLYHCGGRVTFLRLFPRM